MQRDPKALVAAACQGDGRAISELIELFYGRIYGFLRRLTGSDADAADLTQRTFAGVWQRLPDFEWRSSLSSWIHSIAYHAYVDWLRSDHRGESRSSQWWAERVCPSPPPDEVAARNDASATLYASVDALEPELRDTVHLHYYQQLTLQETADAMGVAASTVKYRLRQALSELECKMNPAPIGVNSPSTAKTR